MPNAVAQNRKTTRGGRHDRRAQRRAASRSRSTCQRRGAERGRGLGGPRVQRLPGAADDPDHHRGVEEHQPGDDRDRAAVEAEASPAVRPRRCSSRKATPTTTVGSTNGTSRSARGPGPARERAAGAGRARPAARAHRRARVPDGRRPQREPQHRACIRGRPSTASDAAEVEVAVGTEAPREHAADRQHEEDAQHQQGHRAASRPSASRSRSRGSSGHRLTRSLHCAQPLVAVGGDVGRVDGERVRRLHGVRRPVGRQRRAAARPGRRTCSSGSAPCTSGLSRKSTNASAPFDVLRRRRARRRTPPGGSRCRAAPWWSRSSRPSATVNAGEES